MTQTFKGKHISSTPKSVFTSQTSSGGSLRLKILQIPLALTISLGAAMGWYVWDFYNAFKKIQTQDLRIQDLSNQMIYLDEALTYSARLAATTGNKRWEESYLGFATNFDADLAEARKLFPSIFKSQAFIKADAATDKLLKTEKQAFDLMHQGQREAAIAVLMSPEYEKQKKIYSQGLSEATTALKKYVEANIEAKSQQAFTAIVMIGVASSILLIAWIGVLRMMQRYIQAINDVGMAISTSSNEIATTVEQQERTISQQASSVNQTSTTMDELGASSRQSAEQAEASAAGTRQALSLAEEGTLAVQQTMEGMSTLREKVGAIASQILRLSEQTNQIGGIAGLVSDLANQTNMLALNAAVEAARAGEHGKGFSVVAAEIRKLADESKKSAEKITSLVVDVQAAINTTVMVTDEGTKTVDSGIYLAQGTAETFTNVADSINNVFLNSQQIALNAKQQAIAVQQVVAAMNAIDLGAKETATGITQVKVSAQQLNDAALKLKSVV